MGLKTTHGVVMGHYDETLGQQLLPEVPGRFYSSNTYFMSLTPTKSIFICNNSLHAGVNGIWPNSTA